LRRWTATGRSSLTHYRRCWRGSPTKEFIDSYIRQARLHPDDVGALNLWDAFNLAKQAMMDCGKITGDLKADRKCIPRMHWRKGDRLRWHHRHL